MTIQNRLEVLLAVVLVTACSRAPASSAGQTSPGTSPYNPSAVITWLDCVECTPDQLKAVAPGAALRSLTAKQALAK